VSPPRLAAHVVRLLGPLDGPVAVVGDPGFVRAVGRLVPLAADGAAAAAVVSFVGAPVDAAARRSQLRALSERLPPGTPLALVDHNQPRASWRRVVGTLCLAIRALPPSRARHPAARELQDVGFRVERLRLTAGERLQVVVARR
jgi:hypothetical protein